MMAHRIRDWRWDFKTGQFRQALWLQTASKTEFAMRAEPHELERVGVGLAIDQHQVRADMAVAAIVPGAAQRVIAKARRQRRVGAKQVDRFG
jgi:hypothetical protein